MKTVYYATLSTQVIKVSLNVPGIAKVNSYVCAAGAKCLKQIENDVCFFLNRLQGKYFKGKCVLVHIFLTLWQYSICTVHLTVDSTVDMWFWIA